MKLENVYLLYHIFLAEVIDIPGFIGISSFNKVRISLLEGFKQKEIFFNVTLIINTFNQKTYKPYKAIIYR